jgi:hypothetical protein
VYKEGLAENIAFSDKDSDGPREYKMPGEISGELKKALTAYLNKPDDGIFYEVRTPEKRKQDFIKKLPELILKLPYTDANGVTALVSRLASGADLNPYDPQTPYDKQRHAYALETELMNVGAMEILMEYLTLGTGLDRNSLVKAFYFGKISLRQALTKGIGFEFTKVDMTPDEVSKAIDEFLIDVRIKQEVLDEYRSKTEQRRVEAKEKK